MAPRFAQLSCAALVASTVLANPLKLDFTREKRAGPLVRRANGALNLALAENSMQNSYIVKLSVGTPPQPFQLILDTGSSDLWVPSADDTVCQQETQDGTSPCTFGTFNSSASSTFELVDQGDFQIQYGDGSVNMGDYFSDVVTIGGAMLNNVTLGLAQQSQSPIPSETAQGLLGVGYRGLTSANGTFPTLIDDMFSNGVIERRAFSLYLNDANSGKGFILFGGIDTDKYTGDLVTLPIVPDSIEGQNLYLRYLVDLTSVSFTTGSKGSSSVISPSGMATGALLDSGTTQTVIDPVIFNNIVKGIGAVAVGDDGENVYVAACSVGNGDAAIAYQFGGANGPIINVPISAILEDAQTTFQNGDEACILLMRATAADLPNTILGDSFLRNAYVVYDIDNNEISIAQAKLDSSSSNIQVIPSGTAGLSQVSSTATATASPYTYDNAGSSAFATAAATSAAPSDIPASAAAPTFTGIGAAATSGSGSGSSSGGSSSGAAMASKPMSMLHVGALVSVAACFFAGMLVL